MLTFASGLINLHKNKSINIVKNKVTKKSTTNIKVLYSCFFAISLLFIAINCVNNANAANSVSAAEKSDVKTKQDSNPVPDNTSLNLPKFPDSASYSKDGKDKNTVKDEPTNVEQTKSIPEQISDKFNENYDTLKASASATLAEIEGEFARFSKTMSNDKSLVNKFYEKEGIEVRLEIGAFGGVGISLDIISGVGSYGTINNIAINTGGFAGFSIRNKKRHLYLSTLVNGGADFILSNEPYVAAQSVDVISRYIENVYRRNPNTTTYDDSYTYHVQTALSQSNIPITHTGNSTYQSNGQYGQIYRNINVPNNNGDPLNFGSQFGYGPASSNIITEEQVVNKLDEILSKSTNALNAVTNSFITNEPKYGDKYPNYSTFVLGVMGYLSTIQGDAFNALSNINNNTGKIYNLFQRFPSGVPNQKELFSNRWDANGSGNEIHMHSYGTKRLGLISGYGNTWLYYPQENPNYQQWLKTDNKSERFYYTNPHNGTHETFGIRHSQLEQNDYLQYSNHMGTIILPHQASYIQPINPSYLPSGETGYNIAFYDKDISYGWHGGHRHLNSAERDINVQLVNNNGNGTIYITGSTTFTNIAGNIKQTDNGEHTITGENHKSDGEHIQTITVNHDNAINITQSVNSSGQEVYTLSPNANHTTINIYQAANPVNTQNGIHGVSSDVSVNQRVGLLHDKLTFKDTQFIPYAVGTVGTAFGNSVNPMFGEGIGMLASFDYYSAVKVGVFFETSAIQMIGTGAETGMTGIGVGAKFGLQFGL